MRGFSADDDDDNDEEDDASSRSRDVIQVPCAPVNAGPAMGAAADPCLSVTPRDGADIERKSACMSLTDHPEPRKPGIYYRPVRETTDDTRKNVGPPEQKRACVYIYTHKHADLRHFPILFFLNIYHTFKIRRYLRANECLSYADGCASR